MDRRTPSGYLLADKLNEEMQDDARRRAAASTDAAAASKFAVQEGTAIIFALESQVVPRSGLSLLHGAGDMGGHAFTGNAGSVKAMVGEIQRDIFTHHTVFATSGPGESQRWFSRYLARHLSGAPPSVAVDQGTLFPSLPLRFAPALVSEKDGTAVEPQKNPPSNLADVPNDNSATSNAVATEYKGQPYHGYTFWSSDFHVAPIADLKALFEPLHMRIIDQSLSYHCHTKEPPTCADSLDVLTKLNGITLGSCPNQLRRDFFAAYVNDATMATVDAVVCHHAAALCEAFMPFNKSLIVVASTRFEMGRQDPVRWRIWVENLRAIATKPRNIVAANNKYDAEYIKYFTGIKDVPVLPNDCGYVKAKYAPSANHPEVLVGPGRSIHPALYAELRLHANTSACTFEFTSIRELYKRFDYTDLARHPAVVLLPYQVSIMSIIEYYRMGLPMFVPSLDLLTEWHLQYRVMAERTWDGTFHHPKRSSAIDQHPNSEIR